VARALGLGGGALLVLFLAACAGPGAEPEAIQAASAGAELMERADKLFGGRKYAEARGLYARASQAGGSSSVFVQACARVARCESILGQPLEGRPWLALAQARARAEEPLGWSRVQQVLGIYEREEGQGQAASRRFEALFEYCLEHELFSRAIDAAHHVVLATADFDEQLAWSRKGIAAAEQGGLQGWLAVLWNNLGASLEDRGRFADALMAYEEARRYHDLVGDDRAQLVADWAVGHAQRLLGQLTAARATLEAAHTWALARQAAEPGPKNAEWVGYTLWDLAEIDWLEGASERALVRLKSARLSLLEARIETWGEFGQRELARLDQHLAEWSAGDKP